MTHRIAMVGAGKLGNAEPFAVLLIALAMKRGHARDDAFSRILHPRFHDI